MCFAFVCLHPCVQAHMRNQACEGLMTYTTVYVRMYVLVCVYVNDSVMWEDQLHADSLNTWAESIIMRVTTQWITNRGSSSRGRTEYSAAGDVIGSPVATAGFSSGAGETAAALPPQNNKHEQQRRQTKKRGGCTAVQEIEEAMKGERKGSRGEEWSGNNDRVGKRQNIKNLSWWWRVWCPTYLHTSSWMSHTDSLSGIHNDRNQADCGTAGPLHIDADCSDTHPHLQDTQEWWRDEGNADNSKNINHGCWLYTF